MRKIYTYGGYFEAFKATLAPNVVRKIDYVINILKTQELISKKFVKSIGDGLYELRVEVDSNIYRIFFIFDKGNIVVLFNGFQKKSQKNPKKEIEIAKRIMREYYDTQK